MLEKVEKARTGKQCWVPLRPLILKLTFCGPMCSEIVIPSLPKRWRPVSTGHKLVLPISFMAKSAFPL